MDAAFARLDGREQELLISVATSIIGLRSITSEAADGSGAMSLEQLHLCVASMKAENRHEEAQKLISNWIMRAQIAGRSGRWRKLTKNRQH